MEEREEGNLLVGRGNWGNLLVRGVGGDGELKIMKFPPRNVV